MKRDGICLITFSDNPDHQNVVYSMFRELKDRANVFTVGISSPKSDIAAFTSNNYYYDCPRRPGLERKTFRIDILLRITAMIRKNRIRWLYFESQHIWNALLMILCPDCIRIQAIHDVVPHDGNRAMDMSNYVTGHLANHVILRNNMEKDALADRYRLPKSKISCIELWRDYPDYMPVVGSGIFLCFGRIRRYKGYDQLAAVIENTPEITYRIVGKSDGDSADVVRRLRQLPNAEVIDLEVSDADMKREFCAADWVLLPYASATQSGVIVDSYRFSRPVIAFDVGTIQDQIVDGKTGFLVDRGDVKAFEKAVRTASEMPAEQLKEMSVSAWQFGHERYSAQCAAGRFLNLISHIERRACLRGKCN